MTPHHVSSLSVSFKLCSSPISDPYSSSFSPVCERWHPTTLKLIPNASPERPFPVPHEGVDKSEGVVVFGATLPERNNEHRWVTIAYSTSEEHWWISGGFVEDKPVVSTFSVYGT
jgi:GPI inositol-deacylase